MNRRLHSPRAATSTSLVSASTRHPSAPGRVASPTRRPRFGRAERDGGEPVHTVAAKTNAFANALLALVTISGAGRRVRAKATHPGGYGNSPREGDPIPTHVLARSSRRTRTRQDEIGARSKMTMLNTFERRLHQEIERLSQSKSSNPTIDAKPTVEGLYSELSHRIIGAAIEVHRHLGPGQLESVYERALAQELAFREIPHRSQVPITVSLQGLLRRRVLRRSDHRRQDRGHRAARGARRAELLSCLDAAELRIGLLINFQKR